MNEHRDVTDTGASIIYKMNHMPIRYMAHEAAILISGFQIYQERNP